MKTFAILALAASTFAFTSCNTMIGIGRDMRLAGEGMEKAANKATSGDSGGEIDSSGAPIY